LNQSLFFENKLWLPVRLKNDRMWSGSWCLRLMQDDC
jgi:hypothetical protein